MSEVEIRLISRILERHFGHICCSVAVTLAIRGALPLHTIAQHAALSTRTVKEALFILLQHDLVRYELVAGGTMVNYRVESKRVLGRLGLPGLCAYAYDAYGPAAAEILLELAEHGKASTAALTGKTAPHGRSEALNRLLETGMVEIVTAQMCMSRIPATGDAAGPSLAPKSSPAKKRKAAELVLLSPSIDQKAKSMRLDAKETRYCRICSGAMIRVVREQMLLDQIEQRINKAARIVLAAALGSSTSSTPHLFGAFELAKLLPPGAELSVVRECAGQMIRATEGNPVAHYLECLTRETDYVKKRDDQTGGRYFIDSGRAEEQLRRTLIEAYLRSRFGSPSARIYRILCDKQVLEERQISRVAMLTGKETRERLYALLEHGFIRLQEVPRTSDHAPSRTIYLWTVSHDSLARTMAQRALKTMCNLLDRANSEYKINELLLLKTERSDVVSDPKLLSVAEREQLVKIGGIFGRIDTQICRIIREYLLFSQ